MPITQARPAPHAAPFPQRQAPFRQVSATSALQAEQAPPAVPQLAAAFTKQALLAQQPAAQPWALQAQDPLTQRSPAPHAAFMPQRQAPPAQLSAMLGSHAVQALPMVPQAEAEGTVQTLPLQHPVGQLCAVQPTHTPAVQTLPIEQAAQAPPIAPQAPAVVPGWHWLLASQHPLGHVCALQAQVLLTHAWPAPQAEPLPHWQAPLTQAFPVAPQLTQALPPVPHADADGVTQLPFWQQPFGQLMASHTHWPPLQRWPGKQAAPMPQRQLPLAVSQVPPRTGSQAAHWTPPVPQAPFDCGVQTLLLQHPVGQLCAVQAQLPFLHT